MSDTAAGKADSKSDIWIAAGVVVCLALGASLTYWLSKAGGPPRRTVNASSIQGVLLKEARPTETAGAAAAGNPATAPANLAAPVSSNPDFLSVTFDTLSGFFYEIPNLSETPEVKPAADAPASAKTQKKEQIPAPIKSLGGKKVAVQGFMVPIRIEKGATKSFLLVKDQSLCCYGRMPRMNEWISVKMSGDKSAKFIGDQPVTVFGKLDVGEEIEKGEVLSIYRMEAEDIAGPLDL